MKNAPVRHRIEYGVYSAIRLVLGALPHAASRHLGGVLGDLAWTLAGSRRRTALENVARVFPGMSDRERRRLARDSFHHLGVITADTVSSFRFDAVELCARLKIEGLDNLDEARAAGHGVLAMSAHIGTWEIAAYPVGLYREPMHAVGRPLDNPHLDRHLIWSRTRFGNDSITKRDVARESLRVLRRGGIVGILIDQRVRPEQGIEVPFLGHDALTSPLVARLAIRTGAPVVPLFAHLEPEGRYRVVFHEPIWPDGTNDVATLTRRYLEVVEEQILARPGTWLWMHRRWRK